MAPDATPIKAPTVMAHVTASRYIPIVIGVLNTRIDIIKEIAEPIV